MAFQDAAKRARPVILEPVMKVEVVTTEKLMGDVSGSINSRRGQILEMFDRGMNKVIRANVPLAEMFGYVTTLRSISEGRASSTMEFGQYEVVPPNVAKEIIEARGTQSK
jgi:elongation factor G